MFDWFVGDGELAQIVTTHLGLWRGDKIKTVCNKTIYSEQHRRLKYEMAIVRDFVH